MDLLASFVGCSLLIAALGVPLARRGVPPNWIYGVRVRATRKNPDVWYEVNEKSGRDLIIIGVLNTIVAFGLFYVPDLSETTYALACAGTLLGTLTVMSVRAMIFTRQAVAQYGANAKR